MASPLSTAIAAADRLFDGDSAANGAVFDTALLGGPDPGGRFAAFARRPDTDPMPPARLVGLFPDADAANAALARDRRSPAPYGPADFTGDVARIDAGLSPADAAMAARWRRSFGLGVPAAGVLIPGSALYPTDADGNPICGHPVGCPHDI